MPGSKKYQFNKNDLLAVTKVLSWSAASAVISGLLILVPMFDIPGDKAAIATIVIPLINSLLVAVKRFVEDRSHLIES